MKNSDCMSRVNKAAIAFGTSTLLFSGLAWAERSSPSIEAYTWQGQEQTAQAPSAKLFNEPENSVQAYTWSGGEAEAKLTDRPKPQRKVPVDRPEQSVEAFTWKGDGRS